MLSLLSVLRFDPVGDFDGFVWFVKDCFKNFNFFSDLIDILLLIYIQHKDQSFGMGTPDVSADIAFVIDFAVIQRFRFEVMVENFDFVPPFLCRDF